MLVSRDPAGAEEPLMRRVVTSATSPPASKQAIRQAVEKRRPRGLSIAVDRVKGVEIVTDY